MPRQLAPFSDRLAITYLSNLSLVELMERTKAIDGPAAILFVDFTQDATGVRPIPARVIRTIAAEARVPVFGSYSTHLGGGGGVGGYVLNMKALGGAVGEKALAILKGTAGQGKIETLAISEYQFDWPEFERWGFDETKLPRGSIIMNRPPSLWETYKWYIIVCAVSTVVLVMFLEAAVIALYRRRQRKQEAELLRLDRLNLVGEMAAGIGHEIRNPMTTVRGYLQMFQQRSEYGHHKEQLATMIEELDRANAIIGEYLSLAKTKLTDLKRGNLNETLGAIFPLMQVDAIQAGRALELSTALLPDVDFDEKELRQLVLNLVRNGLEVTPKGGTVTISTLWEGDRVVLAVRDMGGGIPKKIAEKIGTPFMTTKENGTGLGLSVCYRIAQRHGAKIDFTTGKKGTTFYVRFPVPS